MTVTKLLIFDGDDTLWENNILFERVIARFVDMMQARGLDRRSVRARLDQIERRNSDRYGYGVEVFERSLVECLAHCTGPGPCSASDVAALREACLEIARHPLSLIEGVAETVAALAERHTLYLLTKGHVEEQDSKVTASGLRPFFERVLIVPEKTVEVYTDLLRDAGNEAKHAWMIGNSPRSDILPARAAGLGTVLVPHHATWSLEMAEMPAQDDRFIVVESITELTGHFLQSTSSVP